MFSPDTKEREREIKRRTLAWFNRAEQVIPELSPKIGRAVTKP